jgi:DNA-binding transcriptional MerR regulator
MELTRDELLQRLRISRKDLEEWRENDLLSPLPGVVEVYAESAIEEGELIKKFSALGYALKEIQKIKRSVGLPVKDEKGKYVSKSEFLTIGELAEKSGINARTIKFWEEKGLISPFRRTEGGFRLYRQADVALISYIKDLQTFNYTLAEIGNILQLADPDPSLREEMLSSTSLAELEKLESALSFLVDKMREVREASLRVEAIFARRLRAVSRVVRQKRRTP